MERGETRENATGVCDAGHARLVALGGVNQSD